MKKALLFAIIALSLNAFAQSNRPIRQKLDPATNTIENMRNRMMDMVAKTPAMNSGMKLLQSIQLPSYNELSVFQKMDSVKNWVWYESGKARTSISKTIHIVYDNKNNLKSQTEQNWTGSAWVDTLQSTYTYDAGNNPSVLMKSWTGSAWVNSAQIVQTYAGKNLLSMAMQMWDGSAWMDLIKSINTYDANNNMLSEVMQWFGKNASKTVYTYFNNNMTSKEEINWNDAIPVPGWESSKRYTWEYDGNNNKTKELVQLNVEKVWTNFEQTVYTYVNNKLTKEVSQNYDGSNWINDLQTLYTYTGNNKTKETHGLWNGSAFPVSSQSTFTYDDRNNLTGELQETYNLVIWKNFFRYIYTYDANNNQTSASEQDWDGSTWRNTKLNFDSFDANNFTIGSSQKVWNTGGTYAYWSSDSTHYYFHAVVTGIAGIKDAGISVYPNPSRGKITLSSNSAVNAVEIFSLSGKRVYADYNLKPQTSNDIDLTGYAKGIYIMKVHNGAKVYISKVVVQ